MADTIETKWQYVARVYREIGDEHNAEIADKIDALLATIPEYERTTVVWDDDIASGEVDDMDIVDVVQCSCYCTACAHSPAFLGCDSCIFAEKGGRALYFTLDIPVVNDTTGDE